MSPTLCFVEVKSVLIADVTVYIALGVEYNSASYAKALKNVEKDEMFLHVLWGSTGNS